MPHRRQLPPAGPYPTGEPFSPPAGQLGEGGAIGNYFSFYLWRAVMQQAARHRYWMRGAAIAYGMACCLFLSFFVVLAMASLGSSAETFLLKVITQWLPASPETIRNLVSQTASKWTTSHRWWLLVISGGLGIGLWLKVIGSLQQVIRSDGDLASHLVPSFRQRTLTVLVAVIVAGLLLLAIGFISMTLPEGIKSAIAAPTAMNWVKRLLVHALRWSLALSTIALMFGLLYRASQKPSAAPVPVLPGTLFTTALWLMACIGLKIHIGSLADQHWLYGLFSTVLFCLVGLYCCVTGLLLGGQYNKLIQRYFPQLRSRQVNIPPPPPAFESFTIERRHPR
ncbi:YhjD/YihY/BrkB family envelope integrity protein [Oscillatoria sp. CS-180]|nr:YhjD/YihY/BrkB family envelope integrity protein [Oscillatoria sp. CS-180]